MPWKVGSSEYVELLGFHQFLACDRLYRSALSVF